METENVEEICFIFVSIPLLFGTKTTTIEEKKTELQKAKTKPHVFPTMDPVPTDLEPWSTLFSKDGRLGASDLILVLATIGNLCRFSQKMEQYLRNWHPAFNRDFGIAMVGQLKRQEPAPPRFNDR